MTREEIMQLNTDYLNGCESEHKMNELFSYALEQQPCEDAISRQAVLEPYQTLDDSDTISVWLLRKNIEQQPPVISQQKYGKWKDYRDEGFVECPFCGHATNCEDDIDELHYCFYCGAKMVEPQESEVKEYEKQNNRSS